MHRRVLITGARAAAALDLARDFNAAGWQVHLADSRPVRMARWSCLALHHHEYPPPIEQREAFRASILALMEREVIDLVVPTCEEVFHLAAPSLHAQLGARLFATDLARLRQLHDKFAFASACREWGLPIPESHLLTHATDVARFAPAAQDWVFKPCFTRFGNAALIGPTSQMLAQIAPTPDVPWLAQRRVSGDEACFYAVAHRGKLVAFAAYKSGWRLDGGASYAFEPLCGSRQQALRDIAERLALRADIHGQFACDAIFDAAGQPFLIECNPRATSGVHLLAGDGALARAIGEGVSCPAQNCCPAYLGPAMLAYGLPHALRRARLGEWFRLLRNGRDAIGRAGDRLPMLGAVADAAGFFRDGRKHSISTTAATTRDIAWNGEDLD
ncbi:ATP-grasp domain-containing protein [Aurantiacibacter rhizosphaerae]|uniref:ATP-grasp domain-containing protein n=1 Tax=Aurantiacibacter rhizosphaerae TaxID=2691582 RepID=A0A844XH80_9SPHN|nr:ATP-grasp domain-containing protein [Aurantiacibacter rhizosphaerae]MWV28924.1 ATP-grasp domain-containing protein [Aurantiacibacter rhizosphaerae]